MQSQRDGAKLKAIILNKIPLITAEQGPQGCDLVQAQKTDPAEDLLAMQAMRQ
jgi:hypothetical protein